MPLLPKPQTHTTKPCRCTYLQLSNPSCPQPLQTEITPGTAELWAVSIPPPGSSRDPVGLSSDGEHQVPTLRLRCAGSDLQSRSMCSPTTTSGISPRLTGTGVLQRGHTGTCTSCRNTRRRLGACSWATLSAVQTSLSLSGPACHGLHSITCGRSPPSPPAGVTGADSPSGKGGQQGWEMPKPYYPVAQGGLEVCSTRIQILAFRDASRLSTHPKRVYPSDQRDHKLF